MDEMYRMLGREREADLEREAGKWSRAAEARHGRRPGVARRRLWLAVAHGFSIGARLVGRVLAVR
jgi:hypothetical protein